MKTVIYARVINSVSDEPIENGMVEIEDDHIVYVGEKRECTDSDAQIFDLEGKTVMPGFIDAHAHLCGSESIHKTGDTPYDLLLTTVRDLKDLVDAGVTGVRDMSAFGVSLKRAIEAGLIKGPVSYTHLTQVQISLHLEAIQMRSMISCMMKHLLPQLLRRERQTTSRLKNSSVITH